MRYSIVIFAILLSFPLLAQETTNSRRAAKAFREAKSSVAVQDYSAAKTHLNEALLIDDQQTK